jgi:hypothetical protein
MDSNVNIVFGMHVFGFFTEFRNEISEEVKHKSVASVSGLAIHHHSHINLCLH